MKQLVQKVVVATIAVAAVGAALMWSGQSLPSSHASSGVQSSATAVALPPLMLGAARLGLAGTVARPRAAQFF